MKKEIIKPGIIRSIIQKVEYGSHERVSEELVNMILDALLDTIVEALENGDQIILKGYMTIYPQLYSAKNIKRVLLKRWQISIEVKFQIRFIRL